MKVTSADIDAFHLRFCNGFWSPCVVEKPFGPMLICYPDYQSLLWQADLQESHWSYDEIINSVEDTAKRFFGNQGFQFSENWTGDVDAFKKVLTTRGYEKTQVMGWYQKALSEDYVVGDNIIEVKSEAHKRDFLQLFSAVFTIWDVALQRMAYQLERPMNDLNNAYYLCYQESKAVGLIACAWDGNIGYYHSLGVVSEYRKAGVATSLVNTALSHMKSEGVEVVSSLVEHGNGPSEALQESLGFDCYSKRDIWSKCP